VALSVKNRLDLARKDVCDDTLVGGVRDEIVVQEQSPFRFAKQLTAVLVAHEGLNQNLLGLVHRAQIGEIDESRFASVTMGGALLGGAGRGSAASGWWFVSASSPEANIAASLADWIVAVGERIRSVESDPLTVSELARRYALHTNRRLQPALALRVMECTSVIWPRKPSGHGRAAAEADLPLLEEWMVAFDQEANAGQSDEGTLRERLRQRVANPRLIRVSVWDDRGPVSMVMSGAPTVTGEVVGMVYTPEEHRGRGYAGHLVAEITHEALQRGRERMFLQADATNPVSNALYLKLGYREVGTTERWDDER
jgi:predicted GNAT family acetyltransferase